MKTLMMFASLIALTMPQISKAATCGPCSYDWINNKYTGYYAEYRENGQRVLQLGNNDGKPFKTQQEAMNACEEQKRKNGCYEGQLKGPKK